MAWLDFLFGFQGASPYAFRFERRDLMVGGELETPDGLQYLRRSTAAAGSLTDANGHLVADQRMARMRAMQQALATTPRRPPPTITGRSRIAGSSRFSTAA